MHHVKRMTFFTLACLLVLLLSPQKASCEEGAQIGTLKNRTSIMSAASSDSARVRKVNKGETGRVLEKSENGRWLHMTMDDGSEGWVPASLVTLSEAATPPPVAAAAVVAEPEPGPEPTQPEKVDMNEPVFEESAPVFEEEEAVFEEEEAPPAEETQPEATEVLATGSMQYPVDSKDFCALKPKVDTTRFVKSRVIIYPVTNAELVETGETTPDGKGTVHVLKRIEGRKPFSALFTSYFPMKRFHTVLGNQPAPADWFDKETLALSDIQSVAGGSEEGRFVAYSASCADYIALPRVTGFNAKWSQSKGKINGREVMLWNLTTTVNGGVMIFRRENDTFVKHAEIEAGSGGLLGFASGLGGSIMGSVASSEDAVQVGQQTADGVSALALMANRMDYISVAPANGCSIPERGIDGEPALQGCQGDVVDLPEAPGIAGMGENQKPCCKELNVERPSSQAEVALCEIRKASELFALSASKECRGVDGWRLYAPLQLCAAEDDPEEEEPAISLGDNEGVRRGMGFYAVETNPDGRKKKTGFAKVTKVGPGGEMGEVDPSLVAWRYGSAKPNTRMEEHPQIGLSLGGEPFIFVPLLGDKSAVNTSGGNSDFPAVMPGVAIDVGYDLTPYTFDEFWLRANIAFAAAPTADYLMGVVNTQVGPEARMFLFSRTYWYGFLGGNFTAAFLKAQADNPASSKNGEDVTGSGFTGGLAVKTGFDIMFNADFYLRLSAGWIQNFKEVEYKKDDEVVFLRKDNFSGLTGLINLSYVM